MAVQGYSRVHKRQKGKRWRSNRQLKDSGRKGIAKSEVLGAFGAKPNLKFVSKQSLGLGEKTVHCEIRARTLLGQWLAN